MEPFKIDRRTFIQNTAILGGGLALTPLIGHTQESKGREVQKLYWYHHPLRILQTVLREPDVTNYDAKAVVGYMEKTKCNTLIVNAGGIVDFFQNPLPAANINSFMGSRDVLKEITEACHASGIRVIGRVDFRGVEEKIYRQFPDWFSVDRKHVPIQLNYTRPQLYASCYNGYYRNAHAEEFIKYLMEHYALDGIWHNSIGISGICYCSHCEQAFRSAAGKELPDMSTSSEADLNRYMEWKSMVADKHMEHMKKTVKSYGDDKVYTAEVFSMFETGGRINSGIDLYNARDHFDFLVSVAFLTENTEIIEYEDLSYANTIIKFLKSMSPEKEAIILYGGNGTSHRYVMEPPVDLKVWLWQALAAGGRFWNCSFTGPHPDATHDRRNAFHNVEAYQFVKEHEKVLSQHAPIATIGVYYSRSTRLYYRNQHQEGDRFDASIKGMENVLAENHIPFDFLPDNQISKDRLSRYHLVILPNVKCLSDKETELLKNYVGEGGSILATYETSLYNDDGSARKDFSLSELFGCHFTGEKINTKKDCYQFIADPSHPVVLPDSADTELFINAGYTLLCKTNPGAKMICTYVPLVHNQPPEKAWTTEWSKEFPTLLENRYKKGKVLYFTNQPDQISYDMGHPDMRNLLKRSIQYLAGNSIPIETNAPESVHVGLTRSLVSPDEYIFSLVNVTSGPVRPLRSILPVYDLRIKVRLKGTSLSRYNVLRAQSKYKVTNSTGDVEIQLDKLQDFFCIHLVMRS